VKQQDQRDGAASSNGERVAVIISKDTLEELLSPLGFALAGACAGMEVVLYFQGPGVRVLDRRFLGTLSSMLWKPFSRFARRGMASMGHAPPAAKLDLLQRQPGSTPVTRPCARLASWNAIFATGSCRRNTRPSSRPWRVPR